MTALVYLDTQDFSRFGDVVRGVADPKLNEIFEDLKVLRHTGLATFVVSMPLLSELLQYDSDRRDIVFAKAKAVEELCGTASVPFPAILMSMETAQVAAEMGLGHLRRPVEKINLMRQWYPDISGELIDYRNQITQAINEQFASMDLKTRQLRQRAKTIRRKISLKLVVQLINDADFENELGFPSGLAQRVISDLLEGRINPYQASTRLFEYVAQPEKFVEFYFEKLDNDRSLPFWMRSLGEKLYDSMTEALLKVQSHEVDDFLRKFLEDLFKVEMPKWRRAMFSLVADDLFDFLETSLSMEQIKSNDALLNCVPSVSVSCRLFLRYLGQALGLYGKKARLEKSFGGDLVHSMYLPTVNLWRGDRRTSAALISAVPEYADRVISKLADLPNAIRNFRHDISVPRTQY